MSQIYLFISVKNRIILKSLCLFLFITRTASVGTQVYKLYGTEVSFYEAVANCESQHGFLAAVINIDSMKNDFKNLLSESGSSNEYLASGFIDIYDVDVYTGVNGVQTGLNYSSVQYQGTRDSPNCLYYQSSSNNWVKKACSTKAGYICRTDKGILSPSLICGKPSKSSSETFQNSVQPCVNLCWQYLKPVASMKLGKTCMCLDEKNAYVSSGQTACSKPCQGNIRQNCGGDVSFAIYPTAYEPEPSYQNIVVNKLGCYNPPTGRTAHGHFVESLRMTVKMCIHLCKNKKFNFASLYQSKRCYCMNSLSNLQKIADFRCSVRCAFSSEYCGGSAGEMGVHTAGSGFKDDNSIFGVTTSSIYNPKEVNKFERYLLSSFQHLSSLQVTASPSLKTNSLNYYGYGNDARAIRKLQTLETPYVGNVYNNPWSPTASNKVNFIMVNFYGLMNIKKIYIETDLDHLSYSFLCVQANTSSYYLSGYKLSTDVNRLVKSHSRSLSMSCYQTVLLLTKATIGTGIGLDLIGEYTRTDLINECAQDFTNDCAHICIDTISSYYCLCKPGYVLASDRKYCFLKAEKWCGNWTENNGNCYKFVYERRTYTQAVDHCESIGGFLTSVQTPKEQAFLSSHLKSFGKCDSWLIGLTGSSQSGFRWVDRAPLTLLQFDKSQFSKGAIYNKNVVLRKSMGWNWAYEDVGSKCFICKTPFPGCDKSLFSKDYNIIAQPSSYTITEDGLKLSFTSTSSTPYIQVSLKKLVTVIAFRCISQSYYKLEYRDNADKKFKFVSITGKNSSEYLECGLRSQNIITPRNRPIVTSLIRVYGIPSVASSLIFDMLGCPSQEEKDYGPYELCGKDGKWYNKGFLKPNTVTYVCEAEEPVCKEPFYGRNCSSVNLGMEMKKLQETENVDEYLMVFRGKTDDISFWSANASGAYVSIIPRTMWSVQKLNQVKVINASSVTKVCPFSSSYNSIQNNFTFLEIGAHRETYIQKIKVNSPSNFSRCLFLSRDSGKSLSPFSVSPTFLDVTKRNHTFKLGTSNCSNIKIQASTWVVYRSSKAVADLCLLDADFKLFSGYSTTLKSAVQYKHTVNLGQSQIVDGNYKICFIARYTENGSSSALTRSVCGYFNLQDDLFQKYLANATDKTITWSAAKQLKLGGPLPLIFRKTWSCTVKTSMTPCTFMQNITGKTLFQSAESSEVIQIPGGYMDGGKTYVFQLNVTDKGRAAIFRTVVNAISPTDVPYIKLRCMYGCDKKKIASTDVYRIQAVCQNCQQLKQNVTYKWTVTGKKSGVIPEKLLIPMVDFGIADRRFYTKANKLNIGEVYHFNLTATFGNSSNAGNAAVIVHVNSAPDLGRCFFLPPNGTTVTTNFSIECRGFTDEDTPLTYSVLDGRDTLGSNKSAIISGLYLPIGDKNNNFYKYFTVTVTDSLGLATSLNVSVQVKGDKDENKMLEVLLKKVKQIEDKHLNSSSHHSKEDGQLKSSIAVMLNKEVKTVNITQKAKIRELLLKDTKEESVADIQDVESKASLVNLIVEKNTEVTPAAEGMARDSFKSLSSSFKSMKKVSIAKVQTIATSLLYGTSKLLSNSISRGEKYLSAINDTAHVNSTSSNENVTETKTKDNSDSVKQERNSTTSYMEICKTISDAMFDMLQPDDPPLAIETSELSLTVGLVTTDSENYTQAVGDSGAFVFDTLFKNSSLPTEKIPYGYQIGEYKKNPFVWSPTAKDIDVPVMSISMINKDDKEIKLVDLSEPIDVTVNTGRKPSYGNEKFEITLNCGYNLDTLELIDSDAKLLVVPSSPEKTSIVFIKPLNTDLLVQVLPTHNNKNISLDTIDEDGYSIPLNKSSRKTYKRFQQDPYLVFFERSRNVQKFYLGISAKLGQQLTSAHIVGGLVSIKVHVEIFLSHCAFWDEEKELWSERGCKLTNFSTVNTLHCLCNHLTAFSGSFLVKPNFVDPISDSVLFLTFFDNPVVVLVVILIWIIYFFLLIWTRREDRGDTRKRGVTVLEDNEAEDQYVYLIGVLTGWWRGAGTTADVFIYLRSRDSQSARHALNDSEREIFQSGGEDWFLLTTPGRIGTLKSVVIWHNNAGESPSWYLKEVVVKDIQTGETWHCLYNHWLSVLLGPGELKADIPALKEDDIRNKSLYQFGLKTSQDLRDGHLWISIFSKPVISDFTRSQRLTCALSLLLTCMLTNLMFLGIPDEEKVVQQYSNKFTFDWTNIIIGVETALLMFPINFTIVQLFVRLEPRHQRAPKDNQFSDYRTETEKKEEKAKTGFKLPWWFIYISWTVAILSCLICSFFVMLYGLKYGYDKSLAWLIAFFTSFTQSACITQPAKVLFLASLITLVMKRPANYTPSIADDELGDDEEYLHREVVQKQTLWQTSDRERPHYCIPPMSKNDIKSIRHRIMMESYIAESWREIFMYVVFVVVVILTVHGHRNVDVCYRFTSVNEAMFTDAFVKIKTVHGFWNYTETTLVQRLQSGPNRSTQDGTSYLLGRARLRQVRQEKGTCDLPYLPLGSLENIDCSGSYWMGVDQTGFFNQTWKQELQVPLNNSNPSEWDHQTSWELKTIAYMGHHATYPGGGYVLNLPRNETEALSKLSDMQKTDWIDERTRAVFIEFTLYNPNKNLFSVMILLLELTNLGGVFPSYAIYSSTLYHYANSFEVFVAVCEAIFSLFVVLYTYFELRKFFRNSKTYFKDSWSYVEVFILSLSYAAFGLFLQRMLSVSSVLKNYKSSNRDAFVSFYTAMSWDFTLQYVLACLVTLVIVKFFKLLKFNRNMSFLSDTLRQGRKMLVGFSLMITVATMAFTHFGHLAFGTTLKEYSDVGNTIVTLFNFALGVSDYFGLYTVSPNLGVLFFFVFSVFFQYILLTMFIAIIHQAFNEIRKKRNVREEIHMVRFLLQRLKFIVES